MKKILGNILVGILAVCMLSGCGNDNSEELEAYKSSMNDFYGRLSFYDGAINAIDADSESAPAELLDLLDQMNVTYREMAEYEIPDEFSGISDIAAEAADYMEKANVFYHQAYDNEFDEDSELLAEQYYERANARALVMLQVLHGEVPTGDGISVETESTYQFSTVSDDSETEVDSESESDTE